MTDDRTISATDVRRQVFQSLTAWVDEYDLDGIVRAIIQKYGRVNIDDIDSQQYWDLVADHDRRLP